MKFIKLGDFVKCKVTGFKGKVVGKSQHLYANPELGVLPTTLSDGQPMDTRWFDANQMELDAEPERDMGFKKTKGA